GNDGSGYGENLSGYKNCRDAVKQWYDEKINYTMPIFTMDTGHYTQVVWRETQWLGCGQASLCENRYVIVCNYYPSGNMKGAFK
ncbi:hypothetical protein B4U79_09223, partial [Dinothrombium tinctorium]